MGIVGLDESRGGFRPRHVTGQIETIAPVRVRFVFVGQGPKEDVVERAVTSEQMAQPETLVGCRPDVRVRERSAVKVEQNQLDVHALGSQRPHQLVKAAEEHRIQRVQVGLARRAAPGPAGWVRDCPRLAVAHRHPDKVEPLRPPRLQILSPQLQRDGTVVE